MKITIDIYFLLSIILSVVVIAFMVVNQIESNIEKKYLELEKKFTENESSVFARNSRIDSLKDTLITHSRTIKGILGRVKKKGETSLNIVAEGAGMVIESCLANSTPSKFKLSKIEVNREARTERFTFIDVNNKKAEVVIERYKCTGYVRSMCCTTFKWSYLSVGARLDERYSTSRFINAIGNEFPDCVCVI